MLIGSFFVDPQALFDFVAILLESALFLVALGVALVIASPSLEKWLMKFERWCGRGN